MRFSIGAIFVVTIAVAVALAGLRLLGPNGIVPVFTLVGITWFILSRIPTASLYPINKEKFTVVELVVLIAIGGILQGLFLPAG